MKFPLRLWRVVWVFCLYFWHSWEIEQECCAAELARTRTVRVREALVAIAFLTLLVVYFGIVATMAAFVLSALGLCVFEMLVHDSLVKSNDEINMIGDR